MYRNDYDYRSEYDHERYRDYYERERYGPERERHLSLRAGLYGSPPPLDDHYYRRSRNEPLLPHPTRAKDRYRTDEPSVILTPPSLSQVKPPLRERPPKCNTVFVGTLPEGTNENHLYEIFYDCGPIQDVRIARNKTFGHVEFKHESSVDKAILLNGYIVRVRSSSGDSVSSIQVDFAQSKELSDAKRRMKSGELLVFNATNAQIISTDLRNEDTFEFAAKNLIQWMEKGSCSTTTANTFFGLLSSVNTHCFKVEKDVKIKDREEEEFLQKKADQLQDLLLQCDTMESVFDTAMIKKAWDNFTKPQRKTVTQWKDHLREVCALIKTNIQEALEHKAEEPDSKKRKIDEGEGSNDEQESKLLWAEKEIEQLKVDHEVAMEKKEKQILQLKTLLARFKKNCPDEWEKIIVRGNTEQVATQERDDVNSGKDETEWEVIDGVNIDDLSQALNSGDSLASAAAAYAQLRTQLGSTADETSLGLSENDIALVSVIAAFLTVHPLGATVEEIEVYFQTLNKNYTSIYLLSLLRRLPKVFQLSQGMDGQPRWWFLGFQTVNVQMYNRNGGHDGVEGGAEEQNETIEMLDD